MNYALISYWDAQHFMDALGDYQKDGWTVHTFTTAWDTPKGGVKYTALLEKKNEV